MNKEWVFGDKEVSRRFRTLPEGVRSSVTDSITLLTARLKRKVGQEKLRGQVLKVRSGRLWRSVRGEVITDGNVVSGVVSTNVKYGRAHEYGGLQTETVREHLRKVKIAFGKRLKSPVFSTVRAHSRAVNFPERSFLRSALAEMQGEIVADLEKAVATGIAKK